MSLCASTAERTQSFVDCTLMVDRYVSNSRTVYETRARTKSYIDGNGLAQQTMVQYGERSPLAGSIAELGVHSTWRDNVNYECNRWRQSVSRGRATHRPENRSVHAAPSDWPLLLFHFLLLFNYYSSTLVPLQLGLLIVGPLVRHPLFPRNSLKEQNQSIAHRPTFIKSLF